jgi:hypothetical protein
MYMQLWNSPTCWGLAVLELLGFLAPYFVFLWTGRRDWVLVLVLTLMWAAHVLALNRDWVAHKQLQGCT